MSEQATNEALRLETVAALVGEKLAGGSPDYTGSVHSIMGAFGAATATLHRAQGEKLEMIVGIGLPEPVRAVTQSIPFGKGIAGLCAERQEPVTLCNLQTDDSGQARPGAKQTGVAGAIAVPVFAGGVLVGTLGVGKVEPHDYSEPELAVLRECADLIGRALSAQSAS